jgi:transposase
LQHSLITHHLPLYFPEAERYLHSSRAEWFTALLLFTPCPAAVQRYTKPAFVAAAREHVAGRKVDKARWLADFYDTACQSVGLPVAPESETMRMFRVVLEEYRALCQLRKRLEDEAVTRLAAQPDFVRLQTLPGIGPILAMIILAEARDLRRFGCVGQFLKYCGFDLCTEQSGQFRGTTHLSKRGNARLRYAFWMAGTIAIRMQQNTFRRKFEDYIRPDPKNADRRRKGYTAVATKMARVAYAVITTGTDYRRFPEATRPGGRIPSPAAVEAHATS